MGFHRAKFAPLDYAKVFPGLTSEAYALESDPTTAYNCFAWAADDTTRKWAPTEDYYWPEGAPLDLGLDAFVTAFALLGYAPCENGDYVEGVQKLALYVNSNNEPQHAARQIGPGLWTSKIGDYDDITHTLDGLVSDVYGTVGQFLCRPDKTVPKPEDAPAPDRPAVDDSPTAS